MTHQNQEVQAAIIRLSDALCTWERNSNIESVLIIKETSGFVYRAVNGSPQILKDLTDLEVIETIIG